MLDTWIKKSGKERVTFASVVPFEVLVESPMLLGDRNLVIGKKGSG